MKIKGKTPAKTVAWMLRRSANVVASGGVRPRQCLVVADSLESVIDWLRSSAKIGGTPEVA